MDTTPDISGVQSKHPSMFEENFKHMFEGLYNRFPGFKHDEHPKIVNVNEISDQKLSVGDKIADIVASGMGSWRFIIAQSAILAAWVVLNLVAWISHWDPYPFIFLNLMLSFQAAYSAPIIMMSQNRQAVKDRLAAENDYKTNMKSEQEICYVMKHLDHQDELTHAILQQLQAQNEYLKVQHQEMLQVLSRLDPQIAQRMKDTSDQ